MTFMGLEGLFGIPLDVAATYIVLFTLYGAVLEYSGAARFFVQLSYAAFGAQRTGPGRTTTLAGFLLGTVSGSGVATTVTLGSVTWPLLRKAGYPKDERRRRARRRRHRRDPVAADARRRRVHHRRVPGGELPQRAPLRDRPVAPVLPRRPARDRGRRAALPRAGARSSRRPASGACSAAAATTSRRCSRSSCCWRWAISPFRAVLYATVLAFLLSFLDRRDRMGAARGRGRAGGPARAACCRSRPPARRPGSSSPSSRSPGLGLELSSPDRRRGRRLAGADGDLQRDRGADPRPGRAGHGLVHHRRGHHRAGAHRARRRAVRRLHVHLLLRGAERGEPADGAVGLRGGGDHRRRRLPHDDADRALHRCRRSSCRSRSCSRANGQGLLLQGGARDDRCSRPRVSAVAVCALAVALGGWLRGPVPLPSRARCPAPARCCCSTWSR